MPNEKVGKYIPLVSHQSLRPPRRGASDSDTKDHLQRLSEPGVCARDEGEESESENQGIRKHG